MTTELGGAPTREQKRAKRIAALAEALENVDLDLAEQALTILRDGTASASVRVQAGQLLASVKPKLERPSEAADIAAERAALREVLRRSALFGERPVAEVAAELKVEMDAAVAERERLRALLAENAAMRARLDAVELRPARVPKPESTEKAESTEEPAPSSGIVPKDGFSLGDPSAPWNNRPTGETPWNKRF